MYSQFNDIQNTLEQRTQHGLSEVYGIDIKNFYLFAPMDRYEYMRMKLTNFPVRFQYQYYLQAHAKNGYVYIEIRRSVYSLPQAVKLAN